MSILTNLIKWLQDFPVDTNLSKLLIPEIEKYITNFENLLQKYTP